MSLSLKKICLAIGLSSVVTIAMSQQAPAWPQGKTITVIVPFAAGGAVDFAARQVTTKLSERLGQSIVIENIAGASGVVGTTKVARAASDGYTLMVAPDSSLTLTPLVTPDTVKYDALKDFTAIGIINTTPYILVTNPGLPVNSVSDLVRYAKAHPKELNYASPGVGNLTHVAMEALARQAGIELLHVPYKSTPQMVTDIVGNQVNMTFLVPSTAMPHIKAGRMKALGVTVDQRIASLPDVPAVADAPELKGFNLVTTIGLFAPGKTPSAIVNRLNKELNEVLASADVRAAMQEQAAIPGSISPADYTSLLRGDLVRNERVVKAANIKAE